MVFIEQKHGEPSATGQAGMRTTVGKPKMNHQNEVNLVM